MSKFKIGDIVTSSKNGYWIRGFHGEIIGFDISGKPKLKKVKDLKLQEIIDDDITWGGNEIITCYNEEDLKLVEETQKFKIGDKVKIPKTKGVYGNISSSNVVNRAKDLKQDYLFITQINGGCYTLCEKMNTSGGDYFTIEDLEYYEETKYIRTDKPVQIAEQILKGKIKYKVVGNKTIVRFSDGRTGFSRCNSEDKFELYYGLALATLRAIYGQNASASFGDKELKDYTNEELINEITRRMK